MGVLENGSKSLGVYAICPLLNNNDSHSIGLQLLAQWARVRIPPTLIWEDDLIEKKLL